MLQQVYKIWQAESGTTDEMKRSDEIRLCCMDFCHVDEPTVDVKQMKNYYQHLMPNTPPFLERKKTKTCQ